MGTLYCVINSILNCIFTVNITSSIESDNIFDFKLREQHYYYVNGISDLKISGF